LAKEHCPRLLFEGLGFFAVLASGFAGGSGHSMKSVTSDIHANTWQRWVILAVLFLARTAMGFQFQAVAALSSFVIVDLGIDYAKLGLLIGLYLLPGVVIAYPGGLLGRYFGDKRTVMVGLALMVAGGLLTMSGSNYPSILAGRLVSGVGAVLLNVLLTKMTIDWFIGREIGTALALLVSSWPIGIGIALVTLPWIAVHGSVAIAFGSTGAAAALVLIAIAILYRAPPRGAWLDATKRISTNAFVGA
jgi:MFS family permease